MSLVRGLYEDGDIRMSLLVECGCFLGLRISDLLSLTWDDVLHAIEDVDNAKTRQGQHVELVDRKFLLHVEKCRQVLGVVELVPVTLFGELVDGVGKGLDLVFHFIRNC